MKYMKYIEILWTWNDMKSTSIVSTWVLSTKWWGWCRWRCWSFNLQDVKNSRLRPSLQHPCKGLHKAPLLKYSQQGSNECRVPRSAKLSRIFVQKTTFPFTFFHVLLFNVFWLFRLDFSLLSTPALYPFKRQWNVARLSMPSVHVAQGDHSQEALSADCGCLHLKEKKHLISLYSIQVFILFHCMVYIYIFTSNILYSS